MSCNAARQLKHRLAVHKLAEVGSYPVRGLVFSLLWLLCLFLSLSGISRNAKLLIFRDKVDAAPNGANGA